MWKWYDPMCRHWCLGSRNSSKHNGNDFIIVPSVFLAADSKVKWWCWCSTSTQSLNTKPTSVQTGNLYAHNVLQRTGLGQNSPPKSHYYAVQTFEIVHQRWCPEKGLQLRHVLGFCYWVVLMGGARSHRVAARSPLASSPVSRTLPCLWNFPRQLKCQLFAISNLG